FIEPDLLLQIQDVKSEKGLPLSRSIRTAIGDHQHLIDATVRSTTQYQVVLRSLSSGGSLQQQPGGGGGVKSISAAFRVKSI
ncbi:hypothetical protein NL529_32935, partial [Klebsiella pneumoniae]|nr:hypothetical protein [Klebsiella pneumoniae]